MSTLRTLASERAELAAGRSGRDLVDAALARAAAAQPLLKAKPCAPPSSAARHASSAVRVGLPLRE